MLILMYISVKITGVEGINVRGQTQTDASC